MKKVIIIGATSGIGRALAKKFHSQGFYVGITGRRKERLEEIVKELGGERIIYSQMDVTDFEESIITLEDIVRSMGGNDVFIYNSGIGGIYQDRERELKVIDTNARGFLNLSRWMFDFYRDSDQKGHIVGI